MGYSEKELLLLSNYVYLDASKSDETIRETIGAYKDGNGNYTPESVAGAGSGGGLKNEQVCELFKQMQQECDKRNSDFGDLRPARRLEEKDIRGICYTDGNDKNPVIIFRGTGGTDSAWQDNMYGSFRNDTRLQKVADDFVRYECGAYKGCVVAGHSKGGNLSQYVTIRNPDKISHCISFDGQGFSNRFIEANKSAVSEAAGKIKSISAHNDFVNILLTTIAGTVVYAKNSEGGANAHSSYYLLTSNEFDSDGNISSLCKQSYVVEQLKKVVDKITDAIGTGTEADNILLCGIMGEAVASLLESAQNGDIKESLANTANGVMLALSLRMKSMFGDNSGISKLSSSGLYFDFEGIRAVAAMWKQDEVIATIMMRRVNETMNNISYEIASRFYTDIALSKVIDDIADIRHRMTEMEDVLVRAVNEYSIREDAIALQIQSQVM